MVGSDLKFYNVFVGFSEAAHDQHVFAESPLGKAFRAGTYPIQRHAPVPFRQALLKPYLLGDSDYKLLPDLIVPYSSSEEGRDQGVFGRSILGIVRCVCALNVPLGTSKWCLGS